MNRKKYQKPSIETLPFICQSIIAVSDKVGLVTDEGSNAAKCESGYFEDDDDMEE